MRQEVSLQGKCRHLHFDALVQLARQRFGKIADQRCEPDFSLPDALMAGLALFSLKDPSMLAFQRRPLDQNLRCVFGLQGIPSDSQLRAILDGVDPNQIRPFFNDVLRKLHQAKVLDKWRFQGHFLVALDGVEYFCSKKVHCAHCMTRHHSDGSVSYYHQMLGAAIVHPDFSEVIPLAPEPIQRQDGQTKNDCERNAARRWAKRFREDHPNLPVIVIEDALSSNAPHIHDLRDGHFHFLLGVKDTDHAHLFEQICQRQETGEYELIEDVEARTGTSRGYLFMEDLSLNESNQDVKVNFLQCLECHRDGKVSPWSWVTDLKLTASNVRELTRGGRARWRIENETFNTLKNQGYHFEHNFGHGSKNLSVVMALLMLAAFLIDQVQQKCNPLFQAARKKKGPKCALWEEVRHLFATFEVSSMREVYEAIAFGFQRPKLKVLIEQSQGKAGQDDTS
jgi:hypothetical protein